MESLRARLLAIAAAAVLSACGGGNDDSRYEQLVSFGDSLSDVGSYAVGTIGVVGAQTGGAGRWTVNGPLGGQVWIEQLAERLDLPEPCAAETGLLPNAPGLTGAPVTAHPGCTGYAQGSARVSSPLGLNSVAMQSLGDENLGLMAKPIKHQLAAHLASVGGRYSGEELVVVLAGANDVLMELALTAPTSPEQAVANVAAAGAELGQLVRSEVVGKGAHRVLVLNVPYIAGTPYVAALGAEVAALADAMTRAFNQQLAAALNGVKEVRVADTYGLLTDMLADPGKHGLSNVTDVACGPNAFSPTPDTPGTSVLCNASNLLPGDRTQYLFADAVHPTPYTHGLFADFALDQLRDAGWR